jgi:hypothetical protein
MVVTGVSSARVTGSASSAVFTSSSNPCRFPARRAAILLLHPAGTSVPNRPLTTSAVRSWPSCPKAWHSSAAAVRFGP